MAEPNQLHAGLYVGGGRFTLMRLLGRGGMGQVWLAEDTTLGEWVALKFLPPEVAADPVAVNDLRRETARSHRLTHPNIIRLHDFHQDTHGHSFISMEYVDGPTLSAFRLQQAQNVLTWEQLKPLVRQLCAALEYAHGEGVIHRDLKPGNIMLDSKGRVKLADFGIAAVVSDSASRVSARPTSGTLAYMSPQQLAGKRPTVTDDVYALGGTLYELLTSQLPFFSGDVTHQVLHEAPEPIAERLQALGVQNAVPADVAALIMACLAKEPAQRPQSAHALAEWIGLETSHSSPQKSKELLPSQWEDEQPEPALVGPPIKSLAQASPRRKATVLVSGFLLALLLACAVRIWTRVPPRRAAESNIPAASQSLPVEAPTPPSVSVPPPAADLSHSPAESNGEAAEPGFVSLFNGHDLSGWTGDPRFWSVEDGAIKGQSRESVIPEKNNTYLIWQDGVVGNFELRFSYKLVKGELGSGVLYRGRDMGNWSAQGYQADFWPAGATTRNGAPRLSGNLAYEAPGGGSHPGFGGLASPGEKVFLGADGQKSVSSTEQSPSEIQAAIHDNGWNDYVVTANGDRLIHRINGVVTVDVTDQDAQRRFMSGIIALKMRQNAGRPMLVYFKNIQLKQLSRRTSSAGDGLAPACPWVPLFNGKTLSGWTALSAAAGGRPDWSVAGDGTIVGKGPRSHLFSPGTYTNFEFKAEASITQAGNSGMFFRVSGNRPNGYPAGYEAQIENTGRDPQKTGSLFNFHQVNEQLVPDDTWFTQHVIAIGNRIVIKVNDRIVTDFTDEQNTYRAGRLALQQNPESAAAMSVSFRNVVVKPLPADALLAWAEARKDMPDLPR